MVFVGWRCCACSRFIDPFLMERPRCPCVEARSTNGHLTCSAARARAAASRAPRGVASAARQTGAAGSSRPACATCARGRERGPTSQWEGRAVSGSWQRLPLGASHARGRSLCSMQSYTARGFRPAARQGTCGPVLRSTALHQLRGKVASAISTSRLEHSSWQLAAPVMDVAALVPVPDLLDHAHPSAAQQRLSQAAAVRNLGVEQAGGRSEWQSA